MAEQILHSRADRPLVSEGKPGRGAEPRAPCEGNRPSKTVGPPGARGCGNHDRKVEAKL